MAFKTNYQSLDELAKGSTSPSQQLGAAQMAARVTGADKNKDGVVDPSFLEKEMAKGTVGLWAGLTQPEKVSVVANRGDSAQVLQSWNDPHDLMLETIMPVVMPMLVSAGFGTGLNAALGLTGNSLAGSAVKAGTSQLVGNVANGGGFDFSKFLMATLLKTNFKNGG